MMPPALFLSDELADELRAVAELQGIPAADLGRVLLAEILKKIADDEDRRTWLADDRFSPPIGRRSKENDDE